MTPTYPVQRVKAGTHRTLFTEKVLEELPGLTSSCVLRTLNKTMCPSSMNKYRLKNAGLGEKNIVFRLNGTWNDIRDTVVQTFPPLEGVGGIELLRSSGPHLL